MTKLRDIMTTNVHTVTMEDNVYEVAVKMKEQGVGIIPVVRGDHVVGVITDRDIVIRGIANRKPNSAAVQEVMTTDVISATPDMDVEAAAELMAEHQIRRLPVVDKGKLVGIVALKDITDHKDTLKYADTALREISESKGEHLSEMRQ
jgi:CBS domain-containing protein